MNREEYHLLIYGGSRCVSVREPSQTARARAFTCWYFLDKSFPSEFLWCKVKLGPGFNRSSWIWYFNAKTSGYCGLKSAVRGLANWKQWMYFDRARMVKTCLCPNENEVLIWHELALQLLRRSVVDDVIIYDEERHSAGIVSCFVALPSHASKTKELRLVKLWLTLAEEATDNWRSTLHSNFMFDQLTRLFIELGFKDILFNVRCLMRRRWQESDVTPDDRRAQPLDSLQMRRGRFNSLIFVHILKEVLL